MEGDRTSTWLSLSFKTLAGGTQPSCIEEDHAPWRGRVQLLWSPALDGLTVGVYPQTQESASPQVILVSSSKQLAGRACSAGVVRRACRGMAGIIPRMEESGEEAESKGKQVRRTRMPIPAGAGCSGSFHSGSHRCPLSTRNSGPLINKVTCS